MSAESGYNRALLKISGEALAGERGYGWDAAKTLWIAQEIAAAHRQGRQLGVVVGGGNVVRGVTASSLGVPAVVADQMGMIATVMNAMALKHALQSVGVPAHAMSAFTVGRFVPPFEREKAINYVESGCVVIFGGGTGNPCFTTDSAAALRAVEIDAEVMIKATQVRGVFDKDPRKYPDAVFFDTISPQDVLAKGLSVMDATSVEILSRKKIPTMVIDLHEQGNIAKALAGENVGTTIA